MKDERIRTLVGEIETRFPETRVELRPCRDEEDPFICWFLWVLQVAKDRLCEVEDFAIGRALELYGDEPLPFFVTAASPEASARFLRETADGGRPSTNPTPQVREAPPEGE